MSSGGNSGSKPTKPSSSRRIDLGVSQDRLAHTSLYTRVENAKKAVIAILEDTSNWPEDSVIAVKELLETINNAPDLKNIQVELTPTPGELQNSIEQFAVCVRPASPLIVWALNEPLARRRAMEDVCARLKKTYRKYGSKREFADVVKYPFASLSKDGCRTALRECRNNIGKALAALRDHLPDDPVTHYPLAGQVNKNLIAPSSSQNNSTNVDVEITPISQAPGNQPNLLAGTAGKAGVPVQQQTPLSAATRPSDDQIRPELTPERRRERLEVARTTFETIEALSGTIPVVGSYIGAGSKVGLAVVKMVQVKEIYASSFAFLPSDTYLRQDNG
ncbi:hypothetical protein FRC04_005951 [Tulasnella sp. 424]|nr:hypothetical protein FRC04_005951 [Tulasnella sp. 424]